MLTFCNSYVLWLLRCVQLRLGTVTFCDVNVVWCYVLSQYRVHSYTWYTRVSQNNFLRQKYLAFIFFEDLSKPPFFLPLCTRAFLQHLLPKNALLFSTTQWPGNPFPIFLLLQLFSPLTNECQLFMPKDFLEPPCLTLLGMSLVLRERVEGGGNR